MCTYVVHTRAEVVATKLGIILSSFMHVLPNMRVAKVPERSGGTQPSDLFFLVASGRRSACAMSIVSTPLGARIFILSNA